MKSRLLTLALLFMLKSIAQPGSPVSGFGTNGKVITSIGASNDRAFDLAIQTDGKIVAVGYTDVATDRHLAVVRYNMDGTLDNSFGTNGIVNISLAGANNMLQAVEIQSDGKIIIAGQINSSTSSDFLLMRLNDNGTPDNSFGNNGTVITPVGSAADGAVDLLLQPDGKIIAGGRGFLANNDFVVLRYNVDGSLDNTFDGDGIASVAIGIASDELQAMTLQQDGKIVAVGYSSITSGMSTSMDIVVVRLNADGSLDNTFDGDGRLTTDIANVDDLAQDVAIQHDGKIVVVGRTGNFNLDLLLVRYNIDGSLDNTFDSDGKLVLDFSGFDRFRSISIQTDGKIVVGGDVANGAVQDFGVVRLLSDGTLDNTFDVDGLARVSMTSDNTIAPAMATSSGRIYIAGHTVAGSTEDFALVALATDGIPLPIQLISFTGSMQSADVKIEWRTAGDLNGSIIELQRSKDGRQFFTINKFNNSSQAGERSQAYIDRNSDGSATFYRLKLIDRSGAAFYSKVLALRNGNHIKIKSYPNPAKETLFLQALPSGKIDIRLIDSEGKIVKTYTFTSATNATHMLDVSGIENGSYILKILSKDGVHSLPVILR